MERQKANKIRSRKIKFYYKIASSISEEVNRLIEKMPSVYQCLNTSLGWIDEMGKIIFIDSVDNPYKSNRYNVKIPKYDHGEFLLQELFEGSVERYISERSDIDKKWVKISNMNEISCESYPTPEQLRSFAIVHYICSKRCMISPMNSEEDIRIYSRSEDKFHRLNIGDLMEKFGGEELEDLYYEL